MQFTKNVFVVERRCKREHITVEALHTLSTLLCTLRSS